MIVSVLAILLLSAVGLRTTAFGRAVRATSTNPELAVVTGVRPEVVYGGVIFVSGFLAAVGGVALATETTLTPLLGWRVLIPLSAVAILGGLGSVGATYPALLLGLVSEFSLIVLPASYKSALACRSSCQPGDPAGRPSRTLQINLQVLLFISMMTRCEIPTLPLSI